MICAPERAHLLAADSKREALVPLKVMLFNEGSRLCYLFPPELRLTAMANLEGILLIAGKFAAAAAKVQLPKLQFCVPVSMFVIHSDALPDVHHTLLYCEM